MLNSEMLLDAMGGIREEYIMETASELETGSAAAGRQGKLFKTLLIAAVIAALMTAAAVAAGLLGRRERQAQLPPGPDGEERYTVIPNGFKDSDTYRGSLEWWTAVAEDRDKNPNQVFDPSFTENDEDRYMRARLYFVSSREMLDRLYETAEKYGLELYKEYLGYSGLEEFYKYTGVQPFMDEEPDWLGGYVFNDGSFKAEGRIRLAGEGYDCTINRIRSGSIYPFAGPMINSTAYEESEYMSTRSDAVSIAVYEGGRGIISYVSPDGESFIEISSLSDAGRDMEIGELCRRLADGIDFKALCAENRAAAQAIDVPRAAEDNRDMLEKLMDFGGSDVVKAGKEFQTFFTDTFYDAYFKGTYGMEGYEDIDMQLESLSKKYGLIYAESKSTGNEFSPQAEVYDNGAWRGALKKGSGDEEKILGLIHYIPKGALYTGLQHYVDFELYRRIWPYETACGETVILFTEGPDKTGGAWAFYENDEAYILLMFYASGPTYMEEAADCIDWTAVN